MDMRIAMRKLVAALWLLAFVSFVTYYFWCDPLWKLAGMTVSVHDLESRGFRPWTPSVHLAVRRSGLHEVAEGRDANLTRHSLSTDIVARGNVSYTFTIS